MSSAPRSQRLGQNAPRYSAIRPYARCQDDVEQVLAALKGCDLDALLSTVQGAVAKREQFLELQAVVATVL